MMHDVWAVSILYVALLLLSDAFIVQPPRRRGGGGGGGEVAPGKWRRRARTKERLSISEESVVGLGGGSADSRRSRIAIAATRLRQTEEDDGQDDVDAAASVDSASAATDDAKEKRLSVAIIGSGAVGCYYGGRLWESGKYDVKFLMKGEHYEQSKANGLNITSVNGDMYIPPDETTSSGEGVFYDTPEDIGEVDWVIVALKSTALSAAPDLIRPVLKESKTTRILAIMNGLVDEDLIAMLEEEEEDATTDGKKKEPSAPPVGVAAASAPSLTCCAATYGGMALICSNKMAPGWVDHSYAGKLTVALAASSSTSASDPNSANDDRKAMEDLFSNIKVEFVHEPNLVRGRWTKMVWNLPFNGISVAMGGITVDRIVNDVGLRRLAYVVMDETISIANAELESRGHGMEEEGDLFLGEAEKDQMMTLSDGMGPYRTSTMLDYKNKRPMEVYYLFRKALERGYRLNVATPHLETLVTQIEAFQRFDDLF